MVIVNNGEVVYFGASGNDEVWEGDTMCAVAGEEPLDFQRSIQGLLADWGEGEILSLADQEGVVGMVPGRIADL